MAKTEVISWHISFTFSSDCAFTPGRVLEVYSYHHVDTLQGVTIRYEALQQSTNENVELEALIHIQRRYTIVQPLGPANRLIKLQVWKCCASISLYIICTQTTCIEISFWC